MILVSTGKHGCFGRVCRGKSLICYGVFRLAHGPANSRLAAISGLPWSASGCDLCEGQQQTPPEQSNCHSGRSPLASKGERPIDKQERARVSPEPRRRGSPLGLMKKSDTTPSSTRRLSIAVRGVVQGVGFRPFVYHAARDRDLTGWVANEADQVRIVVQGEAASLEEFVAAIRCQHPPQACIESIIVQEDRVDKSGDAEETLVAFQIRPSGGAAAPRPTIPADLATCGECLAEIRDPSQRRCNYAFTNCTHCGPRWSILEALPYDRSRTSMASFAMCADCRSEYEDPADRRFHAQPIACPRCGPALELLDAQGRSLAAGQAALDAAVGVLRAGRIVAMKGLGGFQLLADATDALAVSRLRERKRRPERPFAIMFSTIAEARRYCRVSDAEGAILLSPQSPIVLLRRAPEPLSSDSPTPLAAGVAPANPYLGAMLPYTPLHHLLMAAVDRPLVCTSGNLSEEPMVLAIEEALERLGAIADLFLTHDRPIVRPVDDSILRVSGNGPQILRRARGFAPLPIELTVAGGCGETATFLERQGRSSEEERLAPMGRPSSAKTPLRDVGSVPTILAVGGHLKNTVGLLLGDSEASGARASFVMSAHIGDLDSVAGVAVFRRAIDDLVGFFQAAPEAVVCDLHPDYASTRDAARLALQWDVPLLRVQHHHAHVAACMAEHRQNGPALGFAWDGAGYGEDGTIWGGEILFCEGARYRRAAHLRTFPLPGGDRAAREPRRSALGLLFEVFGTDAAGAAGHWFHEPDFRVLLSMLAQGVHSPRTSSMGRLFDATAALCGFEPTISFEGQAAMALEFAADENDSGAYAFAIREQEGKPLQIDWEPAVQEMMADRAGGVPARTMSARFHNGLAAMAVEAARAVSPAARLPIFLTGGCFQNALLAERVRSRLSAAGFSVYTHRKVPPGDGGIALGQAFLALRQLRGS